MDDDQDKDRSRADKEQDGVFELGGDIVDSEASSPLVPSPPKSCPPASEFEAGIQPSDIDLASPFLRNNHEAIEEDWKNMRQPCYAAFLTTPNHF